MRIVAICPHFAPDVAPTGEVMTTLAMELVKRGHDLHIITSLPWYRRHAIEDEWRGRPVQVEKTEWGRITRITPFPTDKTNLAARSVAFGGFTLAATVAGVASRWKPDVVLAMSPPLTLGLAGMAVARRSRVPFVFNVQDIFPDVAIEVGALSGEKVIAAAKRLELMVYRGADAVTVLSEDLAANVGNKLAEAGDDHGTEVVTIPNFVDTDRIAAGERENSYRAEFGLSGRTVVMYAGNIGYSQSLELVVEAARELVDSHPEVVFVINGGGSGLAALKEQAEGLPNVVFVGLQPKERLAEVVAAADIHIVALRSGLAWSSVPSKLYTILAAARPVVASIDEGTEVARVIEAAGAGVSVPPENLGAFIAGLSKLLDSSEQRQVMGQSGRAFVERWLSPAECAEAYESLFDRLISGR